MLHSAALFDVITKGRNVTTDELLVSLSAISITLAGFAAIFRAFTNSKEVDGHSNTRLSSIMELGIAITLLSYLPEIAEGFGLSEINSYRIFATFGGLYYIRWLSEFYSIRNAEHKTPKTYLTACASGVTVFLLFWATALNLVTNIQGIFSLALVIMFFLQGIAFMSQFWAESASST